MLALLLIALQSTSAAVPPAPVQAAPVKRGLQQEFDAATDLQDAGKNDEALAAWEAIEAGKLNKRSRAIVQVRKSSVLLALNRRDEATAAARAGLADLPATDATLQADRFQAWLSLARIAEAGVDYASAAEAYRQAYAQAPTDEYRVAISRGLVETETFVDPDAATRDMAKVDALIGTIKVDAKSLAVLRRAKSQLLLNQGDFAGAQREAGEAVKLLGGLTEKTDLNDVAARSDYAIAALLNGKTDDARRYMAMTGAGRLSKGEFDPAAEMKVPDCGGEAGLKPEDMAVVEFSIADDGSVSAAAPVYAAGGGAVALEFARAVHDWSFNPAQLKTMPPFFRYRTRVELRCSTSFTRPSLASYLDGDLYKWLSTKGVAMPEANGGSDAAVLPALRARLAALEAKDGATALSLVPTLHAVADNIVVPRDERNALERRALAILQANAAPPTALLAVERGVWVTDSADRGRSKNYIARINAVLNDPFYAADSAARGALRLMIADDTRNADKLRIALHQVADDVALPANHPFRVGALVRLASLEQRAGNVAAARTAFDDSGLSARQCALLDAPPKLVRASGVFPGEALVWGFEGWTQVQFDIAADGKVVNERAIVSYPPFVFSKAGNETMADARFAKTFRPDGGLGCGGTSRRVLFRLPG